MSQDKIFMWMVGTLSGEQRRRIEERLVRMSRSFSKRPIYDEVIVLVQPGDCLNDGFKQAKKYSELGKSVRLIGNGVTLERTWPDWVLDSSIVLTELGAYVLEDYFSPWVLELRKALKNWLEVCGLDSKIFLSQAQNRLISMDRDYSKYWPILSMHPNAKFESFFIQKSVKSRGWYFSLRVTLGVLAAVGVSIGRLVRNHIGSRTVRFKLEELRSLNPKIEPEAWFVLLPNNKRLNHQLVQMILASKERCLGLIMAGDLRPVLQRDSDLKSEPAVIFLEGLGELSEKLDGFMVDQATPAETWIDLVRLMGSFVYASTKATWKALKQGPSLGVTHLSEHISAVIRILSIDILNAKLGYASACYLKQRHCFEKKPVFFPTANDTDLSGLCLELSKSSALCIENLHGIGAIASEATQIKFRWNHSELKDFEGIGEQIICAGMPNISSQVNGFRNPIRILILTGYFHRDSKIQGRFPWKVFQDELLDSVPTLLGGPIPIEIRWRPHPADDSELVLEAAQKYPQLELSIGQTFERDLLWADLVVSSLLSSAVSQAILQGKPVFTHAIPEWDDIRLTRFISRQRMFFRSQDLVAKIYDFLRLQAENLNEAYLPEQEARVALFGASQRPMNFWVGLEKTRYSS